MQLCCPIYWLIYWFSCPLVERNQKCRCVVLCCVVYNVETWYCTYCSSLNVNRNVLISLAQKQIQYPLKWITTVKCQLWISILKGFWTSIHGSYSLYNPEMQKSWKIWLSCTCKIHLYFLKSEVYSFIHPLLV